MPTPVTNRLADRRGDRVVTLAHQQLGRVIASADLSFTLRTEEGQVMRILSTAIAAEELPGCVVLVCERQGLARYTLE
jgi:hypothetical protein